MDILDQLGAWLSDERFTANLLAAHGMVVALVLVFTVILYVMNTLVDLSYGMLDPRVKLE